MAFHDRKSSYPNRRKINSIKNIEYNADGTLKSFVADIERNNTIEGTADSGTILNAYTLQKEIYDFVMLMFYNKIILNNDSFNEMCYIRFGHQHFLLYADFESEFYNCDYYAKVYNSEYDYISSFTLHIKDEIKQQKCSIEGADYYIRFYSDSTKHNLLFIYKGKANYIYTGENVD